MPMRKEKVIHNLETEFRNAEIIKSETQRNEIKNIEARVWAEDGKAYQRIRIEQTSPNDARISLESGHTPPALEPKLERLRKMDWN
jgi:hypothetical protein